LHLEKRLPGRDVTTGKRQNTRFGPEIYKFPENPVVLLL
jgi:hypothetical protein